MSADFADYSVLGIVDCGVRGSSYRVVENNSGRIFVWEAVDYSLVSTQGKLLLIKEIERLKSLSHPHLIRCHNSIDQKETAILYLVKEFSTGSVAALVKKCRMTNSLVDESFVWRILYQTSRAAQASYTWGTPCMQLDITPSGVHLDDEGNVKLDFWFAYNEADVVNREDVSSINKPTKPDLPSDHERNKSGAYSLGCLIYELTTLHPPTPHSKKQPCLPPHYSEQLKKLVNIMLSNDPQKRPTIEGILYHPALVSHVVKGSFQQTTAVTSCESASVSSESTVESCAKCQDMDRKTQALRRRENTIRDREQEFKAKQVEFRQKQKQVALLERQAREKIARAEVYLRQIKNTREVGLGSIVSQIKKPNELDSSCYSADTLDSQLQPTAAKLDPCKIVRPPSFAPSVCSRRSVRFESIPEVEEPSGYNKECRTWLENKRLKFKALKKKRNGFYGEGKENQRPQKDLGSGNVKNKRGSICSLPCSTTETQDGILETFFSLKL